MDETNQVDTLIKEIEMPVDPGRVFSGPLLAIATQEACEYPRASLHCCPHPQRLAPALLRLVVYPQLQDCSFTTGIRRLPPNQSYQPLRTEKKQRI